MITKLTSFDCPKCGSPSSVKEAVNINSGESILNCVAGCGFLTADTKENRLKINAN